MKLPDDAGHFVAVELDNRIGDLDLLHALPRLKLMGLGVPVSGYEVPRAIAPSRPERKADRGVQTAFLLITSASSPTPRFSRCRAIAKAMDATNVARMVPL